ncbi:hypothetical protein CGMCC3_g11775 [Colletotrichum fructicola]|nr:uncharacterized protein CGMCC3_g11775 [Colletotrichum fructicola]KAE9572068.1 hypothetical protein CGMCC3_g11775 [Colletotrichum fructicola]KAF4420078.1 putative pathogenesis-related protein [Colletotrichum fructicola]
MCTFPSSPASPDTNVLSLLLLHHSQGDRFVQPLPFHSFGPGRLIVSSFDTVHSLKPTSSLLHQHPRHQHQDTHPTIKMRSSIVLAASGAALVMGRAIDPRVLDPRAMETVWDVDYVTVTVTEGDIPVATPTPTPSNPAIYYEAPAASSSSSAPAVVEPSPAPAPIFSTVTVEPPQPTVAAPTSAPVVVEPETTPTPTPTPTPQPATSAPAAVSTPAATDDLQTACIDSHNVHRGNHSAPALSWDAEIAGYAAITAKTCVFEHDMTTGGGGYGQNLAMWGATGSESLGAAKAAQKAITEQWYNGELNLYTGYGQASPDMTDFLKWGHFTQMVWKDTTTVGCAVEYCAAGTLSSIGSWFTVCNYKKQGNVIGSFDTNVLPALGEATVNAN